MRRSADWFTALTIVAAVPLAACGGKVDQQVFDDEIASVRSEIDDNRSSIEDNSMAIEELRGEMDDLRESLEQMREDFDARITELEDQLMVSLPVHFEFDRAAIRPVDRPILNRFAATIRGQLPGNSVVTVEGFADPAGSEAYNRRLGQRRAEAVKNFLVSNGGLGADMVKTVSFGESRLVSNEQGPGRSGIENRRVTFVIDFGGEIQ